MLGTALVDKLEPILRTTAPLDGSKPWGGYRMVFVGDFGQCPPVMCGDPFHCHALFADFEVVLLRQSHRVTDPASKAVLEKMRNRAMTPTDAEWIRVKCSANRNIQRAKGFSEDFDIFHLATTNAKVDEINLAFIVKFCRAKNVKMGVLFPRRGKAVHFAIGARICILKNKSQRLRHHQWSLWKSYRGNVRGLSSGWNQRERPNGQSQLYLHSA